MKMKPGKNQVTWAVTVFFLCLALMVVYYVIFNGNTIIAFLSKISDSLSGVILGIVLAYILIPLMTGIEKRVLAPIYKKKGIDVSISAEADQKKRSQMRKISLVITMAIAVVLIYSLFSIILPQLISSVREIAFMLPVYVRKLDDYSNLFLANNPSLQQFIDSQLDSYYETLSSYVTKKLLPLLPSNANAIFKVASRSVASIIEVLIDLIVGFIVAIYVLNSKERFITRGIVTLHIIIQTLWNRKILRHCRRRYA
nr:hypothetical protein [Butyrivibrio sp.]